jgi:hypothetical protein
MTHHHHHHSVPAPKVRPGLSLILASAGQRLAGALLLIAALWVAVFWAVF